MKNMKNKLKCVVALILCMSMVFGTNLSTLADGNEAGTKQVQVKQTEAEAADAAEASEAEEKDAAAQSAEQTAETLKQQEPQSPPETAEDTEAAEPQKQETEGTKPQVSDGQAKEQTAEAAKTEQKDAAETADSSVKKPETDSAAQKDGEAKQQGNSIKKQAAAPVMPMANGTHKVYFIREYTDDDGNVVNLLDELYLTTDSYGFVDAETVKKIEPFEAGAWYRIDDTIANDITLTDIKEKYFENGKVKQKWLKEGADKWGNAPDKTKFTTDCIMVWCHIEYPAATSASKLNRSAHNTQEMVWNDGRGWLCKYSDEKIKDKNGDIMSKPPGWRATYGARDAHYIVIKYTSDDGEITYIRCDQYRGEKEGGTYFPVYYVYADNTEKIIPVIEKGIEYKYESVEVDEKKGYGTLQYTPDMQNGYWEASTDIPKNVENVEEILGTIQGSGRYIHPEDMTKEKIKGKKVYLWHEYPKVPEIKLKKIDEDKRSPLAGAKFEIWGEIGNDTQERKLAESNETGKDGIATFSHSLPDGTYTLKEVNTPKGYKNAGEWKLIISDGSLIIRDSKGDVLDTDNDDIYLIENKQAKFVDNVKVAKTAEPNGNDGRTFKITLTVENKDSENITGVTVQDVIDSRFEFVRMANSKTPDEKSNGVLKWSNVTIPAKGKWTASFIIKAKDDFIGGNMIPTNGAESKVSQDGETVYFPKPTVNVKLLGLSVENKDETVFLGDTIYSNGDKNSGKQAFVDQLLETLKFSGNDGAKIPGLDVGAIKWTENNNSITGKVEYSYPYTSDTVGTFTFEFGTTDGSLQNHEAEKTGSPAETYTLKVTYQAKSVDKWKENLTGYVEPKGTEQKSITADGTYKVHVVAGEIKITKEIDGGTKHHLDGDLTFIFRIDRKEDGKTVQTWYRAVKIGKNKISATAELLTDLPRGEYTITELDTIKYDQTNVQASVGNECKTEEDKDSKSITVFIGTGMADVKKLIQTGQTSIPAKGCVTFTNKRTDSGKKTDSDVKLNRFTRIKPEKPEKPGKPRWKHEEIDEPQSKQQ